MPNLYWTSQQIFRPRSEMHLKDNNQPAAERTACARRSRTSQFGLPGRKPSTSSKALAMPSWSFWAQSLVLAFNCSPLSLIRSAPDLPLSASHCVTQFPSPQLGPSIRCAQEAANRPGSARSNQDFRWCSNPASTVWPSGQCANQCEHKNHNQNRYDE